MAQARVRTTGEVIEVFPSRHEGRFCMRDTKDRVWSWDQLERVVVKNTVAPITVQALAVNVNTTVTGEIQTGVETDARDSLPEKS